MKDFQTIYLGAQEDIASIIDHLSETEKKNIIFVIPENAEIFGSIINFRLLKREADTLDKKIFVSTSDRMGRYLAERAEMDIIDIVAAEEAQTGRRDFEKQSGKSSVHMHIVSDLPKDTETQREIPQRQMIDIVAPRSRIVDLKEARPEAIRPEEPKRISSTKKIVEKMKADQQRMPENIITREESHFLKQDELQTASIARQPLPAQREALLEKLIEKRQTPVAIARPRKEKVARQMKKIFVGFISFGIVIALIAFYFILPKATLAITPKRESVVLDIAAVADKNINAVDYSLGRIPAQIVKLEKKESKEFQIAGQSGGVSKAKGIIAVYNGFGASSQTLVQNTRFVSTQTGKLFRTTKTIIIPGAKVEGGVVTPSSIDVEVIADQPGGEYDIGPSDFTIPGFQGSPKYSGFYGKSKTSMSGGSSGSGQTITQADLDNAKKVLMEETTNKLNGDIKDQLPSNLQLVEGAIKQEEPEITFSEKAGSAAGKFTATITHKYTAIAFDEKHLNELIDKKIMTSSGNSKELLADTRNMSYGNPRINFEKGQINLNVKVSQDTIWKLDQGELKKELSGKNEEEIRELLSQMPEIQNAKVTLWPFWLKRMPTQLEKIKIIIE